MSASAWAIREKWRIRAVSKETGRTVLAGMCFRFVSSEGLVQKQNGRDPARAPSVFEGCRGCRYCRIRGRFQRKRAARQRRAMTRPKPSIMEMRSPRPRLTTIRMPPAMAATA